MVLFTTQMWTHDSADNVTAPQRPYVDSRLRSTVLGDFPGGPVVNTPHFHCRALGLDGSLVGELRIPHVMQDGKKKKKKYESQGMSFKLHY